MFPLLVGGVVLELRVVDDTPLGKRRRIAQREHAAAAGSSNRERRWAIIQRAAHAIGNGSPLKRDVLAEIADAELVDEGRAPVPGPVDSHLLVPGWDIVDRKSTRLNSS